jgi:hypothetical protein
MLKPNGLMFDKEVEISAACERFKAKFGCRPSIVWVRDAKHLQSVDGLKVQSAPIAKTHILVGPLPRA